MDTITPLPLPATLPVAGISFRQDAARSCTAESTLTLEPEPGNRYDEAAIRVTTSGGGHLGYIPAALNRRLGAHPLETLTVRVEEILDSGDIIGVRIRIGKGTGHSAGGGRQVAYTTTGAKVGPVIRRSEGLVTCSTDEGDQVTYPAQVLTLWDE